MSKISVDAKRLKRKLEYMMSRGLTVDLSKQINESANIIVKDIKEGVAQGQDINEQQFKPLKPATIRNKARQRMPFPSKPLIATSKMTGALGGTGNGAYLKKRATPSTQLAQVSAPMKKAPYGIYHMEGNNNLPVRKWFGVSQTAERQIIKNLNAWLNRMISGRR